MTKKLFYNGDIITLEDELYTEAVLVEDGKIAKVGKKEELMKDAEGAEMVDLEGKTLIPSFIDPHSHFFAYANSKLQVNLEEAMNFDEIAEKVKAFVEKNDIKEGTLIMCSNFDLNALEEKTYPRIEFLDELTPKNPLILAGKSSHNGVFNSLAMELLGIDENTPDPEGGVFYKEDGKLTGYAEENAYINYIQKAPMPSPEDIFKAVLAAQDDYASFGITTTQEGMIVPAMGDFMAYLVQLGLMKIDYIGFVDIRNKEEVLAKLGHCFKKYNNHFKVGGYKTFLDGSPQGRTAFMRTDYVGEEGYKAYPVMSDEETKGLMKIALEDDTQILVHCNGDAAVEVFMNQYRAAKEELNSNNDIRPVIIHAQLLGTDQLEEVKELGMIPSFFGAHVYHWGDIHVNNFGAERASKISPAKSALDHGLKFTFHQDTPVIDPDMIETMWIAVNRQMKNGEVLGVDERISPLEALKAVTINGAYQYFEEDLKGSIKESKLADLVILDKNPLKVDVQDIRNIKVLETIKEGQTIFKA